MTRPRKKVPSALEKLLKNLERLKSGIPAAKHDAFLDHVSARAGIIARDYIQIPPEDTRTEYSKSSGPGGQNVNKRETAVRLIHIPTNLAVHVESERSQLQNREKAQILLEAKLYKLLEDERKAKERGLYVSKTTEITWGSQIRSYVMHPYKMVKDHRTGVEVRDVEKVLEGGLEEFLEAEQNL